MGRLCAPGSAAKQSVAEGLGECVDELTKWRQ